MTQPIEEFVSGVRRRLSVHRWLNFILASLLPVGTAGLIVYLAHHDAIPRPLELPLVGIAALALLFLFERAGRFIRPVSVEDAARHVDKETSAKERFLTAVTLDASAADVRSVLESQAADYIVRYDRRSAERFAIDRFARVSLLTAPAVAILAYLVVARIGSPPDRAGLAAGSARADELRELAKNDELPQTVQDDLLKLATALDEQGLYSEEAWERLEESMSALEELPPEDAPTSESASVDELSHDDGPGDDKTEVRRTGAETVRTKKGTAERQPAGARPIPPDVPQSGQDEPPPEPGRSDAAQPDRPSDQPRSEPPPDDGRNDPAAHVSPPENSPADPRSGDRQKASPEQSKQDQAKSEPPSDQQKARPPEDQSAQPKAGEEKAQTASLQKQDQGTIERDQSQKKDGAKKEQQESASGSKDAPKEDGGSGKGDKGKQGDQENPNQSTVGVGDGQKGKDGDKPGDVQSEGQSGAGKDDSGAKDGPAENSSAGGAGGDKGDGQKQPQGKDQAGQPGSSQGKQGKQGEKGSKAGGDQSGSRESSSAKQDGKKDGGAGEQQGGPQDLQQVKETLDRLKNEMSQKGASGGQQGAGGEQGGQQGEQQQPGGAQNGAQKAGSKAGRGAGGEKNDRPAEQGMSGQSGGKNQSQKSGEQDVRPAGRKSEGSTSPGDRPDGGKDARRPEPRPDQGRSAEQSGKGDERSPAQGDPKGDAQHGSMNDGAPPLPSEKGTSRRPDAIPRPSDTAERLGPFGGGDEGDGQKGPEKVEALSVQSQPGSIVVRTLGQSDGKRYKNTGPAKARESLGDEDFKKPESDVEQGSQPIPVEYRGILR